VSDPEEGTGEAERPSFTEAFTKKSSNWKTKLSGVLNKEEIFFSLLVLGIFYVCYTMAKYILMSMTLVLMMKIDLFRAAIVVLAKDSFIGFYFHYVV